MQTGSRPVREGAVSSVSVWRVQMCRGAAWAFSRAEAREGDEGPGRAGARVWEVRCQGPSPGGTV